MDMESREKTQGWAEQSHRVRGSESQERKKGVRAQCGGYEEPPGELGRWGESRVHPRVGKLFTLHSTVSSDKLRWEGKS